MRTICGIAIFFIAGGGRQQRRPSAAPALCGAAAVHGRSRGACCSSPHRHEPAYRQRRSRRPALVCGPAPSRQHCRPRLAYTCGSARGHQPPHRPASRGPHHLRCCTPAAGSPPPAHHGHATAAAAAGAAGHAAHVAHSHGHAATHPS